MAASMSTAQLNTRRVLGNIAASKSKLYSDDEILKNTTPLHSYLTKNYSSKNSNIGEVVMWWEDMDTILMSAEELGMFLNYTLFAMNRLG